MRTISSIFFSFIAVLLLSLSVSAVVREAGDITADTREWTLVRGDILKFTHKQLYHELTVESISSRSARIRLDEPEDTFSILEGDSLDLDLNSDGVQDINMTLLGLFVGGVRIELKSYVTTASTIDLLPPAPARTPTRRSELLKAEEEIMQEVAAPEPVEGPAAEPVIESPSMTVEEGLGTKLYYYVGIIAIVIIALVILIGSVVMDRRKTEEDAENAPKGQGQQYPEGLQTPDEQKAQREAAAADHSVQTPAEKTPAAEQPAPAEPEKPAEPAAPEPEPSEPEKQGPEPEAPPEQEPAPEPPVTVPKAPEPPAAPPAEQKPAPSTPVDKDVYKVQKINDKITQIKHRMDNRH